MSLPDEQVERARQVDILEVAKRFVKLKRIGINEYAGPCPRCGGKDRFAINTRKRGGVWNCRHCAVGGNVVSASEVLPTPAVGHRARQHAAEIM